MASPSQYRRFLEQSLRDTLGKSHDARLLVLAISKLALLVSSLSVAALGALTSGQGRGPEVSVEPGAHSPSCDPRWIDIPSPDGQYVAVIQTTECSGSVPVEFSISVRGQQDTLRRAEEQLLARFKPSYGAFRHDARSNPTVAWEDARTLVLSYDAVHFSDPGLKTTPSGRDGPFVPTVLDVGPPTWKDLQIHYRNAHYPYLQADVVNQTERSVEVRMFVGDRRPSDVVTVGSVMEPGAQERLRLPDSAGGRTIVIDARSIDGELVFCRVRHVYGSLVYGSQNTSSRDSPVPLVVGHFSCAPW
jgi:hypothetical protein